MAPGMGRRGGRRGGRGTSATSGGRDSSVAGRGRGTSATSGGRDSSAIGRGCGTFATSGGPDSSSTAPHGRLGGPLLSTPVEHTTRFTSRRETNNPTSSQTPSSTAGRIL